VGDEERRFSLKRTLYSVMLDGRDLVLLCTPFEPVVLKDLTPFRRDLLALLAESRTAHEITVELSSMGHRCSSAEVNEELDRLNERLVLEVDAPSNDSAAIGSPGRNDRTRLWLAARKPDGASFAKSSEKVLQSAHIALFGLGGLGTQLFTQLLLTGIGRITAVDFDRVEESNLNRQSLYCENDTGRLKTDVAAERAASMNSSAAVETVEKKISSADDIAAIMAPADLALLAADTPRESIFGWMNEASYRTGVPVLYTNGVLQSLTEIGPLVIPGRTACYQCSMPEGAGFDDPLVRLINGRHCHGVILPALAMCAGIMMTELLRHLTACEPCSLYDRRLFVDIRNYRMWLQEMKRRPYCPFCGERAPLQIRS